MKCRVSEKSFFDSGRDSCDLKNSDLHVVFCTEKDYKEALFAVKANEHILNLIRLFSWSVIFLT
jgi:hypothetical protein